MYRIAFPLLLVSIFLGYVSIMDDTGAFKRIVEEPVEKDTEIFKMKTVYFPCSGSKCEAFFYIPKMVSRPPVIVMAHGFGAQKDFGLPKFAEVFVKNKYAVFLFDYRTFGGSEGEPRNLVSPSNHLNDWENALEYVSKLGDIDSNNIILWGTSYSGGHVIVTAAKSAYKDRIKAVISQVPFVNAVSSVTSIVSLSGIKYISKFVFFGLIDKTRELLGLTRYYVPISGSPEDVAVLCTPSSSDYVTLLPKNPRGGWQNKCPAEIALSFILYSPSTFGKDVKSPTLLVYVTNDDLCPVDDIREMAKTIPNVREKVFDKGGHFTVYNENFENNINAQLDFLGSIINIKD